MPQGSKGSFPKIGKVENYRHLWLLGIWFVYFACFYLTEQIVTDRYWVSYLPLDDKIPFLEGFVIPYVLWYPMLAATTLYLAFWDAENFKKYMAFIGWGFLSTCVFYLLFPNGQDLRPAVFPRDNFCTWLLGLLYQADTNTNVCPSIHVIGSMAICAAVAHTESLKKLRLPTYVLSTLVSLSTVFVKQHSILDLFAAIPYSFILYILIYKPFSKKHSCQEA